MELLSVFAISGLINGLVVLGLGVFVISHNWRDRLNRLYFLIVIAICIWSFSYWRWLSSNDTVSALFWVRMLSIGSTLIPVFYFHWVASLLNIEKGEKRAIWLVYILSAPFILFSFSNYFISGVEQKLFFPFWPNPGILYHFYLIVLYICIVAYSSYLLLKNYIIAEGENRKRLAYVLAGAVVAFAGGLSNFFLWYSVPIPPYGNFLVVFYPLLFAYATIKYRLFNIKTIATELFIIAIWIFLFVKILISTGFNDFLVNVALFVAVAVFGILLIRSVFKEVRQREQIEKLAGDLEVAFGAEKAAKEVVEKAKAEDEALLGSIGDGVVAVDKQGKIMFVNRAAEEMLGFKSEQAIGKPYEQILEMQNEKGESLAGDKNPLYGVLKSGKKIITDATGTPEKTIYFTRKDKTKFPAAITVAPVILQGKTIGAIDVFRDITVERRIDKSKSEFVSLASHQLRTPLTTIKWYSEMLMDKKAGNLNPKQKEYLNVIYDGNQRMVKLIDIMLDVSRLDAGKVKIHEELVDISKIAKIIIDEEKFNIKERKQKFVFECSEKNPETLTDPHQLRIVFQNVISNAIKYTQEKGRIVCSIKREGDNYLLSIKDSGIGIPKEQQKRIFEKLFRADNAFSHEPDGNGLGLYAAKATIENLGGRIWFESPASPVQRGEEAGKGTTFYVTVPVKH